MTASKTKFGLKAIGKDVKPLSDELHLHLSGQMQQVYKMALYLTLELQAQKPDSAVARLALSRNANLRIFENHRKDPPIEWDRSIVVSRDDLPPKLGSAIEKAFKCSEDLLDARLKGDDHAIWRARSEERKLRQEIAMQTVSGNMPIHVGILVAVSERLACATKPVTWKETLESYLKEKTAGKPRSGA